MGSPYTGGSGRPYVGGLYGRKQEAPMWEDMSGMPSGRTVSDWLRRCHMTFRWEERWEHIHPPTRPPVSSHVGLHSLLVVGGRISSH